VKVVVIYESLTGNTRRAAELIGAELVAAGEEAAVCPVTAVDYQALAEADLVVVGSWTDGVIVAGQRPGRVARIKRLPVIDRKRCVVFCTYAVHPGKTLDKLGAVLEGLGADVRGGMAIRRNDLEGGARELVARVLALVDA
jgi:flavorubredoxin